MTQMLSGGGFKCPTCGYVWNMVGFTFPSDKNACGPCMENDDVPEVQIGEPYVYPETPAIPGS